MRFGVSPQKEQQLLERMQTLGIRESDLEERFIKGSGAGGQKINKTSVCVCIRHKLTGIEVRCQRERSQALNRFLARRELCDRVEQLKTGVVEEKARLISKARRQKAARSRKAKRKMLIDKGHRSEKKGGRRSPASGMD